MVFNSQKHCVWRCWWDMTCLPSLFCSSCLLSGAVILQDKGWNNSGYARMHIHERPIALYFMVNSQITHYRWAQDRTTHGHWCHYKWKFSSLKNAVNKITCCHLTTVLIRIRLLHQFKKCYIIIQNGISSHQNALESCFACFCFVSQTEVG